MQQRSHGWLRSGGIGAVLALALLSGCSTYDSMFGSNTSTAASTPPPSSGGSSSPSFTQRFKNFVSGPSTTTAVESPAAQAGVNTDIDCPAVQVRQGASTFQQSVTDNGSAALSLRYQASFVRFARECAQRGPNVTIKVGVEGRLILGPAGTPGTISLPVRLAVVKEGLEPKTIWTKFSMVPVMVPAGQANLLFTHVEEDVSFPMPPGSELDTYVIYAGFDPDSAVPEQAKRKAPPKRKAKSQ